jgi:hypothetical protein
MSSRTALRVCCPAAAYGMPTVIAPSTMHVAPLTPNRLTRTHSEAGPVADQRVARARSARGGTARKGVRTRRDRGIVTSMDSAFIFLMLVLKLPIVALLYLVWWAIHATPEAQDTGADGDGGVRKPRHPRPPRPRRPRRGPHADPVAPPPPRVRSVVADARRIRS